MTDFIDPITSKLEAWYLDTLSMIPNFVLAVIVLIGFYYVAKYIRMGVSRVLNRAYNNPELTKILSKVIFVGVIISGTMAALSILHLDKTVSSILAGAGIIGLALSFAFQDIAANFMSGFIMAAKRPFEIGDVIEVQDMKGTVQAINLRSTELLTFEGNEVIIPNKIVFQNPVTNYYKQKKMRIDLKVGVSYGDDLDKVEHIAKSAIEDLEHVVHNEPVRVFFENFGDSSINLEVQYWVEYSAYHEYLQAISDGVKAIKKAFDKQDIAIPFPIRTLDFGVKGGKPLSKALSGVRDQNNKQNNGRPSVKF